MLVAVDPTRPGTRPTGSRRRCGPAGIPCEVAPSAAKYGKQIRHADRRGIPYVWFPGDGSVRDIRSGEQVAADPATWQPPAQDLHPSVGTAQPEEQSS